MKISRIKKFLISTILIAFTFLLAYLLFLPLISIGSLNSNGTHRIYISSNEIHTAFLFPKNELNGFQDFINYSDFKYQEIEGIEFSFGDVDFFEKAPTWDKFTFKIFFDALFIPDRGLMHIDLFDKRGMNNIPKVELILNDNQYSELVRLIKESFLLKNNKPILYKNLSYYQTDRFFLSKEKYFILNTCNSWTNKLLKEIGIKTAFYTPHKWGILWHLNK